MSEDDARVLPSLQGMHEKTAMRREGMTALPLVRDVAAF